MIFYSIRRASTSTSRIQSKSSNVRKFLDRQFRDSFVKLAREHDYRARSAFKLLEMNERMRIFRSGSTVLDIGAAPGSWSQVASQHVQPNGYVLGVDLLSIQPLSGVEFIQKADFTDPLVQDVIVERLNGRPVDCVLSDMAPNATGTKDFDHIRIVDLCRSVLDFVVNENSKIVLSHSATFLCKIWDGRLRNKLAEEIAEVFGPVKILKPQASRDNSAELYLFSRRVNQN
ncbi:hypothetical protein M3Y94_00622200 [Aphelenchoides besseyi]|nr:hypothetical protein M3Y94_00622200 [Aphelenchoides besseyi]KAI6218936.1 RRNA methyltransferase 2, mitochondrial [Aphelenchoides besseyi]